MRPGLRTQHKQDEVTASPKSVASHASTGYNLPSMLLMTCQVWIKAPGGTFKALALLDSGSTSSFISERVAQSLNLTTFDDIWNRRYHMQITTQLYFDLKDLISVHAKCQ